MSTPELHAGYFGFLEDFESSARVLAFAEDADLLGWRLELHYASPVTLPADRRSARRHRFWESDGPTWISIHSWSLLRRRLTFQVSFDTADGAQDEELVMILDEAIDTEIVRLHLVYTVGTT